MRFCRSRQSVRAFPSQFTPLLCRLNCSLCISASLCRVQSCVDSMVRFRQKKMLHTELPSTTAIGSCFQ
jgi:hypothetical protein